MDHGSWLPRVSKKRQEETKCMQDGSHRISQLISEMMAHYFAIFCLLKISHSVQPTLKGRGLQEGMITSPWRSLRDNLEGAYHTHPWKLAKIKQLKTGYMMLNPCILIKGQFLSHVKISLNDLYLPSFCSRAANFCFLYFEDKELFFQ